MQPHTTMRHRRTDAPRLVAAVNGMASFSEEDGMRHGGIVPFLGIMIFFHTECSIGAAWGVIAATAGGYGPSPAQGAVHPHPHLLGRFVDGNQHLGARRQCREDEYNDCEKDKAND